MNATGRAAFYFSLALRSSRTKGYAAVLGLRKKQKSSPASAFHAASLAAVLLSLAACAAAPQPAVPGHLQPVKVESTCPPTLVQQARWLQSNLSRVSLGSDKLSATAILGNPARAESFLLTDGSSIEVLFYHTASTICRRPDIDASLLPFVFQNGRLLGYGQNYYHDFIIPQLRAPLPMRTANPVTNAPARTMSEDLPGSSPRVESLSRGKTMPPNAPLIPTTPQGDGQLGRGEPMR